MKQRTRGFWVIEKYYGDERMSEKSFLFIAEGGETARISSYSDSFNLIVGILRSLISAISRQILSTRL